MVDCVTQWLLNPLHKALFKVLRGIAEDGTFNQEAAVALVQKKLRERESQYVASLDLSAATDRLPLFLQVQIARPSCRRHIIQISALSTFDGRIGAYHGGDG